MPQLQNFRFASRRLLASGLMGEQPPADIDRPMLQALAEFGIEPGKRFEIEKLGFVRRMLLEKSMEIARNKLGQAVD